ncbi:MAG: D-alanyl-D-alanine carboxypeptidase, partial [Actinobacteria bacterium]|nr:D-alanyl-D-alanine carboxypeptidase [Actinomycetota bacterium]
MTNRELRLGGRRVLTALIALSLAGGSIAANESGALASRIDTILARPAFRTSTFGILIAHVDSGRVLHEHNAEKLFAPASNTKLLSCGGALAALGEDFRFETRVVATGPLENGVLEGDLVLVASGDPNLSQRAVGPRRLLFEDDDHSYAGFSEGRVVPGDPLKVIRDFARQVRAAGVESINGNITVDDGLFEETYDAFVGRFSAVCVNDNLVDVFVSPGKAPGDPVTFRFQPEARVVDVRSLAKTGADG